MNLLKIAIMVYVTILTAVRMVDIIYVFSHGETSLPIVVMILTFLIIALGMLMIVRQAMGKLRLRNLMIFLIFHVASIVFNMIFIPFAVPVELNLAEAIAAGTLVELFISIVFIYYSAKHIRRSYVSVYENKKLEENNNNDKTSSI